MREIPQQMASLKAGNWQIGVGTINRHNDVLGFDNEVLDPLGLRTFLFVPSELRRATIIRQDRRDRRS